MNVIIATAGEEPAGIIESIKKFPCDKLILIADERGKRAAVPNVIRVAESLNLAAEVETVDPYDVTGIMTRLKQIIKAHQKDTVVINITGGRKTMALAAALTGIASGDTVSSVIYITEESNQVIRIPRLLNPEKLISPEKRRILKAIAELDKGEGATAHQVMKKTKSKTQATWKHLRELEEIGYLKSTGEKPKKYALSESGWLLT